MGKRTGYSIDNCLEYLGFHYGVYELPFQEGVSFHRTIAIPRNRLGQRAWGMVDYLRGNGYFWVHADTVTGNQKKSRKNRN